jgi:hypothetical protein
MTSHSQALIGQCVKNTRFFNNSWFEMSFWAFYNLRMFKICFVLTLMSSIALAGVCDLKQIEFASKCEARTHMLHPTQFTVGYLPVDKKMEKIEKYDRDGKLEKYLKKKVAPAIIGPNGKLYIIDRHHTFTALMLSNVDHNKKWARIEVIADKRDSSWSEFYQFMTENKYFYLYRRGIGRQAPSDLPNELSKLEDDPYRSLSWVVREAGGFKKVNVSYLEFFWARFFRNEGIVLNSSSERSINKVLKRALELARSPKASHLPGYIGR